MNTTKTFPGNAEHFGPENMNQWSKRKKNSWFSD